MTLNIILDLITSRNFDEIVMNPKKEVVKKHTIATEMCGKYM